MSPPHLLGYTLLPNDVDYDDIAATIQELKEELSNIAEKKLASSPLRISNFEATKLVKNCSDLNHSLVQKTSNVRKI